MADELTATVNFRAAKGSLEFTRNASDTYDVSGDSLSHNVQSIPTTAAGTAVTVAAGVGTAGWSFFRNLDTTNYVEIGVQVSSTFYPLCKLKAGEFALFRLATTTFYARANTSAVNLENAIVED